MANNPLQVYSLEQALQVAKQQDKNVLVNMSAIWCAACRRLDEAVFTQTQVRDFIQRHFVYARVEYESQEGKAFSAKYRVMGFPNILLLNADAKALAKVPVAFEADTFLANLTQASQVHL